ncbi:phosphopyruvate hydratase [Candidatus Woesebacteria bacterium RIFCSPHIGHO2_01_FULL_44_10]|uniref:Enolase n=1 Tax=Candidatus Woesebacteria bacterium RIFCSPLOWO2_01_FULL_44_14 TaxID=1802525 RepID=A0A1F8BXD2_9BACT|nr:MAG: phosphopyruvate hydratase [Candidatus Woesebacteria bacterium RIFCSPHIGHO2_01_FULL_44_10]OGM55811.1 MAG: phosphopyruvate hydratase [Candidatus Woesebacteria bacterium RIFCSPHIGHO2_12_FULL_44_11]OGM68727.1 MAG: phosphopyruvate hydratase [Candidatus Woesebacteria bacterium RIFCSPLOWO2_01_FULL_44_14]
MSKIAKIWAREILDSRGTPTVEAACQLDSGHVAVASVPSGASTGSYEALELRDGEEARYQGKGVLNAVNNVNQILGPALVGMDPSDQVAIDQKLLSLDSSENKKKLGANSILAVSVVTAKAGALTAGVQLYAWIQALAQKRGLIVSTWRIPTPLFNMLNGGLHGAGNLDFQEFFVTPTTAKGYSEGLRAGVEIYHVIGQNLARRGAIHSVGDEGGYAPNLFTNADALEILVDSIKQTPYSIGRDVFLGLDVAASTFFRDGEYTIRDKSGPMSEDAFIEFYKDLNNTYHMAVLEDPLDQDAWTGWQKLVGVLGSQTIVVGDDLLATNPKRVDKAIADSACNGILVKPNQIGTVTETIDVVKKAKDAGWKIVVSHRSGETNDWFIADFAVGVGADYVKFGAPCRGERVAKYNRLSSIEIELTQRK